MKRVLSAAYCGALQPVVKNFSFWQTQDKAKQTKAKKKKKKKASLKGFSTAPDVMPPGEISSTYLLAQLIYLLRRRGPD